MAGWRRATWSGRKCCSPIASKFTRRPFPLLCSMVLPLAAHLN